MVWGHCPYLHTAGVEVARILQGNLDRSGTAIHLGVLDRRHQGARVDLRVVGVGEGVQFRPICVAVAITVLEVA